MATDYVYPDETIAGWTGTTVPFGVPPNTVMDDPQGSVSYADYWRARTVTRVLDMRYQIIPVDRTPSAVYFIVDFSVTGDGGSKSLLFDLYKNDALQVSGLSFDFTANGASINRETLVTFPVAAGDRLRVFFTAPIDPGTTEWHGAATRFRYDYTPPNQGPAIDAGATIATPDTVNTVDGETTAISCVFADADAPPASTFVVTMKVRDSAGLETTLVDAESDGSGGLTVTDLGAGNYGASFDWAPSGVTLGEYDLYCAVSDGTDVATDGYDNNLDELTVRRYPSTRSARQTAASAPTRQPNAQTRTLQTARGKRVLQTRGLS
jgi:hypothetical protein